MLKSNFQISMFQCAYLERNILFKIAHAYLIQQVPTDSSGQEIF